MTEKQFHYLVSLSEKANSNAKHKELMRSNIQKLTELEVQYLINDLQSRPQVSFDVWKENQKISDNPDVDMQDYLSNIDFHKQELTNCIQAQDYKQAAIHFITLEDLGKENPSSAATNLNLEKEEKEKIMKEIREVEKELEKYESIRNV